MMLDAIVLEVHTGAAGATARNSVAWAIWH